MWTVLQLIKEASVRLRAELLSTTATKSMSGSAPPAAKRKYSRATPNSWIIFEILKLPLMFFDSFFQ